ncbi:DEAD/DEAH box helicase [Candidatus Berkelbacteria bacterium]|nr:DEAD/DEAH box helicase [Candidatus Berkelbacteria bacterium]
MGTPRTRPASASTLVPLTTPVTALSRVGPAVAAKLERLGIRTVRDLILHWPRAWQDLTQPTPTALLRRNSLGVVRGTLHAITIEPRRGKRKLRVTATLRDGAGDELPVVWFNQAYLANSLREGQEVLLVGTVTWDWQARRPTLSSPRLEDEARVVPMYPETEGLTSKFLRGLIAPLLPPLSLPDPIGAQNDIDLVSAARTLHAPESMTQVSFARRRLALDELCALQYRVLERRRELEHLPASPIPPAVPKLQSIVKGLPFTLSNGQRRAAWDIVQDLARPYPMSRLLLGDVGSGKTVVAALAAVPVLEAGYHVAWMAPTQVLATQLADRLTTMLTPHGYAVSLVLGGTTPEPPSSPTLFVGTHALTTQTFGQLGLVIIDEQHRFGVRQRGALVRGTAQLPHVLTMSATPIPRSLALTLYGDLDLVMLHGVVAHRAGVTTVQSTDRQQALDVLRTQLATGRQGFVVVPRIERTEHGLPALDDVRAAYAEALPGIRIASYHGAQRADEQTATITRFMSGEIDLLIATTIVEVGIDVPNATVMVVEEAERYGLAQLHQLRGRVGRGAHAGHCFLISASTDAVARNRLSALAKHDDGLALAELDLVQRGPGELLGLRQAGFPPLRLASLTDVAMLERARSIVTPWLSQPPDDLVGWLALYGGTGTE